MKNKFQTTNVITVSLSHFFHDVYSAFLAPMLPLLIEKLGISLYMAGMLDVARKIPSLMNPLIGLIADKSSVKYMVIFTPAITAITMSLLGNSSTYFILFILLFVSGISSTLFHVPSPVMIKEFSGNKTGTGMSFYMFGGEMARTIGPLVITTALSLWGLEGSFRVMPIGIIASVILYIKLKNVTSIHKRIDKNTQKRARDTVKQLIPLFVFTSGFMFFRAGMKLAITLYLPTYIISKGGSLWLAGITLSVLQFAGAAGTFGAGYIADKIGHKTTLLISAIISPLFMLAMIYSNETMTIPMLILTGIFLFASSPIILALVQKTNTQRPAFVNSIYMTINFSISSVMTILVGMVGDYLGLDLAFKTFAMLAFLSIPFVFILPTKPANSSQG